MNLKALYFGFHEHRECDAQTISRICCELLSANAYLSHKFLLKYLAWRDCIVAYNTITNIFADHAIQKHQRYRRIYFNNLRNHLRWWGGKNIARYLQNKFTERHNAQLPPLYPTLPNEYDIFEYYVKSCYCVPKIALQPPRSSAVTFNYTPIHGLHKSYYYNRGLVKKLLVHQCELSRNERRFNYYCDEVAEHEWHQMSDIHHFRNLFLEDPLACW
jgi:hypothetical protein